MPLDFQLPSLGMPLGMPLPNNGIQPIRFQQPNPTGPLNPQEEQDLISKLAEHTLGGLGYVGGVLDKTFGGRAIRGVLGGVPREALSVLPFSDTLGITDPAQTVRGKDLIDNAFGKPAANDTAGTVLQHGLGIGAEIALDPATYLSFGSSALTKLGQTAGKAGVLPTTMIARIKGLDAAAPEAAKLAQAAGLGVGDVAGKPLGGLFNLGIPFSQSAHTFGTGQMGQTIATKLNNGWNQALYSAPGRAVSALVDPAVSLWGQTARSTAGQRAARQQFAGLPAAEAAARGRFIEEGGKLESNALLDAASGRELRQAAEGTLVGPARPGVGDMAQNWQLDLQQRLDRAQDLGRSLGDYGDMAGINYFPRQMTPLTAESQGAGRFGRQFETLTPNQARRDTPYRDIPMGTEQINDVLRDAAARPAKTATDVAPQAEHIRNNYFGFDPQKAQQLAAWQAKPPPRTIVVNGQTVANPVYAQYEGLQTLWDRSFQLAHKSQGLPDQFVGEGLSMFGNHPLADLTKYRLYDERAHLGTKALYDMLAEGSAAAHAGVQGAVPVGEVLKRAGLRDYTDAAGATIGASKQLIDRLVERGTLPAGATIKDLAALHVTPDVASDALRYGQSFTTPSVIEPFLNAFDSITNLTKAHQTALWPAFHTRNSLTGMFMNWIGQARDPRFAGPQGYTQPFLDALHARQAAPIAGANAIGGLTHLGSDAEATRALAEEAFVHDVLSRGRSVHNEAIGLNNFDSGVAGGIGLPGREADKPFADILKGALPTTAAEANPLAVAGVTNPWGLSYNKDVFAPTRAGRELSASMDDIHRMSAYIAYRRQGYEPALAAARAKAMHYDYSMLTPFERSVMRRTVPFYSWMRRNVPTMVEQLALQPGGRLGQTIRGVNDLHPDGGFLPENIGEGLAIPVGQEDNGNSRYLTNFGLPFEDAFDLLSGGPNAGVRSLQKLLGRVNPIIKGPLEVATGKQFYSGRNTADLYSRTGNPLLDQIIMNSPAGRLLTTVGTLTDERKGASGIATNLLGPGRITDVDMQAARQRQVRDYVTGALSNNPNVSQFVEPYVRPENLPNLSPEELMLLRLYRTLEQQARQQSAQAQGARNFAIR